MKLITTCTVVSLLCPVEIGWSADPLDNWTTSTVPTTNSSGTLFRMASVAFGNGRLVGGGAVSDQEEQFIAAMLFYSSDGATWTRNPIAVPSLVSITWGNGQFCAVGLNGLVLTSADGISWTEHSAGTTNSFYAITYGNREFVAVGSGPPGSGLGAFVASSPDGVTWTPWYWAPQLGWDNPGSFGVVAYGNNKFVALGQGLNYISVATSVDGVNWTQHPAAGPSAYQGGTSALTFGSGLFVAVGGYLLNAPASQEHATIWTSPDGLNWSLQLDKTNVCAYPGVAFTSVAYGAGQFVVSGPVLDPTNGRPVIWTSSNGTNWVVRDVPASPSVLTFRNGRFLGLSGTTALQSGVIGKLGASLSPGSGVQGTLTGVTGQQYAVQSSTNLVTWSLLTNITINTNGLAQFSDPAVTNFSHLFYDARLSEQ
ncbi:MAG: hypothetical protein KGS61_04595 [Verrucomicrobia bacterium]|nr:hypothetical protein [Verrucomicrobiota bacterium]